MRALFSIAFRRFPVDLVSVKDEREAREVVNHVPLDLFLVDVNLNASQGLEVAEEVLRRAKTKVPIVLVTAEPAETLAQHIESGRCVACLAKPIALNTFASQVMRYVRMSEAEAEQLPASDPIPARLDDLAPAFLASALTKSRDFSLRSDSALLEDGALAQAAHQWAGTSGIDCLPKVETEARRLERLANTKNSDQVPEIRALLAQLVTKFEHASSLLSHPEQH